MGWDVRSLKWIVLRAMVAWLILSSGRGVNTVRLTPRIQPALWTSANRAACYRTSVRSGRRRAVDDSRQKRAGHSAAWDAVDGRASAGIERVGCFLRQTLDVRLREVAVESVRAFRQARLRLPETSRATY